VKNFSWRPSSPPLVLLDLLAVCQAVQHLTVSQRYLLHVFYSVTQVKYFKQHHNRCVFVIIIIAVFLFYGGVRAGFVIPVIALGFTGAQNGN
jgi:hypothetical protein